MVPIAIILCALITLKLVLFFLRLTDNSSHKTWS
jgi:hypothetical protein